MLLAKYGVCVMDFVRYICMFFSRLVKDSSQWKGLIDCPVIKDMQAEPASLSVTVLAH